METFPERGTSRSDLAESLAAGRAGDGDWRRGRLWSLVYYAGDDILAVAKEAYLAYFSENGLGLRAFPSLARLEREVVAMTADLLHAPGPFGSVTAGGTDSILLATLAAREWARAHRAGADEILLPTTAHPAYDKAAHAFGLRTVRIPVDGELRADPRAIEAALTPQTAMIVASAPSYTHGILDPVEEIGDIAARHGVWLHVDACVGGFFLPFLERGGETLPPWDFRVPGVVSISADAHKFGYAAKGASVVLYRSADHQAGQGFDFSSWPGGRYATPTLAGTRPGGPIAAAWAVMRYLGVEGYVRLARTAMQATRALAAGIPACGDLAIFGRPCMSLIAFGSPTLDPRLLAAGLDARGWYVGGCTNPPGLHLTVTAGHLGVVPEFLGDLRGVVADVRAGRIAPQTGAPRYGG